MPICCNKADEVYIVTSGKIMSVYAANNITKVIARYASNGTVRLGGIICNRRNLPHEDEIAALLAVRLGTKFIGSNLLHNFVRVAKRMCKTVRDYNPTCFHAQEYRYQRLARSRIQWQMTSWRSCLRNSRRTRAREKMS